MLGERGWRGWCLWAAGCYQDKDRRVRRLQHRLVWCEHRGESLCTVVLKQQERGRKGGLRVSVSVAEKGSV